MTTRGEIEGITDARQLEAMRRAACVALGIEFVAVAWPSEHESEKFEQTQGVAVAGDSKQVELSDADWDLIAPLLPSEAPQTKSMLNRDFLEAVLTVMRRGGTWASRYTPAADIEAVRRRFGRWAHQGVFQAVAVAIPSLALSPETTRLLELAGERARRLKTRATR